MAAADLDPYLIAFPLCWLFGGTKVREPERIHLSSSGYSQAMEDLTERIRYARDRALAAEKTERRRLAEADTADLQSAASVRLATRQAVREALDDILDEESDPDAATEEQA